MKTRTTTAIIAITLSTLAVGVASISILFNYEAEAQQTAATQVLVGGGNNTYPFFGYSPQQVQIKAGGSVVWKAPTSNAPPEPHTVTFVFNNKTTAGPDALLQFQVQHSLCLYLLALTVNQISFLAVKMG